MNEVNVADPNYYVNEWIMKESIPTTFPLEDARLSGTRHATRAPTAFQPEVTSLVS